MTSVFYTQVRAYAFLRTYVEQRFLTENEANESAMAAYDVTFKELEEIALLRPQMLAEQVAETINSFYYRRTRRP